MSFRPMPPCLLLALCLGLASCSRAAIRPASTHSGVTRRSVLQSVMQRTALAAAVTAAPVDMEATAAQIDVNNCVATEFTACPGLYPTIASKLVKRSPFKSKKEMYAALDSDLERERLRSYDKDIVLNSRDADMLQYKNAGVYFKGKGGDSRSSSNYRDSEIAALQRERRQ